MKKVNDVGKSIIDLVLHIIITYTHLKFIARRLYLEYPNACLTLQSSSLPTLEFRTEKAFSSFFLFSSTGKNLFPLRLRWNVQ